MTLEAGKAFYADIHRRMRAIGREDDSLKIMPGASVVVGETLEEAQAKRAQLDSLIPYGRPIGSFLDHRSRLANRHCDRRSNPSVDRAHLVADAALAHLTDQ